MSALPVGATCFPGGKGSLGPRHPTIMPPHPPHPPPQKESSSATRGPAHCDPTSSPLGNTRPHWSHVASLLLRPSPDLSLTLKRRPSASATSRTRTCIACTSTPDIDISSRLVSSRASPRHASDRHPHHHHPPHSPLFDIAVHVVVSLRRLPSSPSHHHPAQGHIPPHDASCD